MVPLGCWAWMVTASSITAALVWTLGKRTESAIWNPVVFICQDPSCFSFPARSSRSGKKKWNKRTSPAVNVRKYNLFLLPPPNLSIQRKNWEGIWKGRQWSENNTFGRRCFLLKACKLGSFYTWKPNWLCLVNLTLVNGFLAIVYWANNLPDREQEEKEIVVHEGPEEKLVPDPVF